MTLSEQRKLNKHIFRLLKVYEITIPIGRTAKGNLGLTFNANNDEYTVMLDSIPLSTSNALEDDNNIELKSMIEKYLFDAEHSVPSVSGQSTVRFAETNAIPTDTAPQQEKPTKVTKNKK